MYTKHGHYIPGSPDTRTNHDHTPIHVARCGGPGICNDCSKETARFVMKNQPDYTPFSWSNEENSCGCISSDQIKELAQFIMDEVPGEPSRSESAVQVAIRLIKNSMNVSAIQDPWGGKRVL